jgi:hypothetical protein
MYLLIQALCCLKKFETIFCLSLKLFRCRTLSEFLIALLLMTAFKKNLTNILHLFVFTCPSRTLWSFEPDLTHLPNLRYLFNAKTSTEDI